MIPELRLFNAVILRDPQYKIDQEQYEAYNRETIPKGYVIDPIIYANLADVSIPTLKRSIEKHIQVSYEQWNQSFYKSWEKIQNTPDSVKVIEQILHYITTYGFETMGIESDFVYLPEGSIELPELEQSKLPLLYIKAITHEEVTEKIVNLVSSGIALKEQTQEDILEIIRILDENLQKKIIDSSRNKEINIRIAEYIGIVPKNPTEFMRYIVYLITGSTLLIQNSETIEKIKEERHISSVVLAFENYERLYGLSKLSESFYRYKSLFLAFRSNEGIKSKINRIRKLAKKYHKPMPEDFLNTITAQLKRGKYIDIPKLKEELKKVNNFRKIRLLYAVQYTWTGGTERVYTIRNGKSYITTEESFQVFELAVIKVTEVIRDSIIESIKDKVKGKTFRIPSTIQYALPATEKQFVGNIPSKSTIQLESEDAMVAGIHWTNTDRKRVDLDLSVINLTGAKIGWDARYSNDNVFFSGDITDAPKPDGASEFMQFGSMFEKDGAYLLQVNYYNYRGTEDNEDIVPFDIVVGKSNKETAKENYLIDPKNILAQTKSEIGKEQLTLGLVMVEGNKKTFCFSTGKVQSVRSSMANEFTEIAQRYLINSTKNRIDFAEILKEAGGTVVRCGVVTEVDYDWQPHMIDKDSFIEILS